MPVHFRGAEHNQVNLCSYPRCHKLGKLTDAGGSHWCRQHSDPSFLVPCPPDPMSARARDRLRKRKGRG